MASKKAGTGPKKPGVRPAAPKPAAKAPKNAAKGPKSSSSGAAESKKEVTPLKRSESNALVAEYENPDLAAATPMELLEAKVEKQNKQSANGWMNAGSVGKSATQ